MRTLLLALGNPIVSDDGVGWEVADRLVSLLPPDSADVLKESGATLDLLGHFAGYDRLIVLDAIQLGNVPIGTVHRFSMDDFLPTVRYSSAHDINFATAFQMGRDLGYPLPREVRIYGIEVKELHRFAEGCTPEVQAKLDSIARYIADDLQKPTVDGDSRNPATKCLTGQSIV